MTFSQINLKNLENNTRTIKELVNDTEIMAIVKADAYGHGAVECSKTVIKGGASCLGVATFEEAMELRAAGIKESIVILTHIDPKNYREAILNDLSMTVSYFQQASAMQKKAIALGKAAKIQIKINTGLNRNGFRASERVVRDIITVGTGKNLNVEGVYSHLADASDTEFTDYQQKLFEFITTNVARYFKFKRHIAASSCILESPELNYEMVRPGLILYGINPQETSVKLLNLKPVMSLHSKVSFIHKVPEGETIGYDRSYVAERDSVIAIVPIGYADGYPSTLSNRARVLIKGNYCMVVGKVCMDQIMVDITEIEHKVDYEYTVVTLFGEDYDSDKKIKIEEISKISGLSIRELMCARSSRRVPKVFV